MTAERQSPQPSLYDLERRRRRIPIRVEPRSCSSTPHVPSQYESVLAYSKFARRESITGPGT
jgi:hypothetical protein